MEHGLDRKCARSIRYPFDTPAARYSIALHMDATAKLTCPKCRSRLDIIETPSGGRTVSVSLLGDAVEHNAAALELFQPPDAGPRIVCPACRMSFDPSEPHRSIPPLNRPRQTT